MTTGIVYDDIYLEHRIGTHVESHERLVGIMDFLNEKKVLENPDFKLIRPRKATKEQINYVHQESLINEVKEVSEKSQITGHIQQLDMDTAVSAKTYEASLYSVGGNLNGIDEIIAGKVKNAFASVRPPGHHSNSYKCAGFCFNLPCTLDMRTFHPLLAWPNRMKKDWGRWVHNKCGFWVNFPCLKGLTLRGALTSANRGHLPFPKDSKKECCLILG